MKKSTIIALLAAAFAGGCTQAGKVVAPQAMLPAGEESPEFLDRVSSEKHVSENDAMRGVLMLIRGRDESASFADRVQSLRSLTVVDPSWDVEANRPITRGRLAYMLYQVLEAPGVLNPTPAWRSQFRPRGVVLTLTGPTQRYCLRELHHEGVFASSIVTTPVTGGEFVAVLGRADAYKKAGEVPDILRTPSPGQ